MFNTRRWHRLLTLPALLVAIALMMFGRYPLQALCVFPPVLATPWVLHAALRNDREAIGRALTAVRVVGYLGVAWGMFVVLLVPPAGVIVLLGFTTLLVVAGTTPSEVRLAGTVIVLGALLSLASIVLVWFGPPYAIAIPTGFVLLGGGVWWLVEAVLHPLPVTLAPQLPMALAL